MEVLESHAMVQDVHLCLSIPPKAVWRDTTGFLKGKSALRTHREYLGGERILTGFHSWARGHCVSAVGLDEAVIHAYLRNQEQEENVKNSLVFGALWPLPNDEGSFEERSSNQTAMRVEVD